MNSCDPKFLQFSGHKLKKSKWHCKPKEDKVKEYLALFLQHLCFTCVFISLWFISLWIFSTLEASSKSDQKLDKKFKIEKSSNIPEMFSKTERKQKTYAYMKRTYIKDIVF